MNKNLFEFGKNLKDLRIAANLSLRDICKKANYDPSNWSKIERGRISPPSDKETLEKWASALNLDKGSKEFDNFVNQAIIAQGIIPNEVMNNEKMMAFLPAFFRTTRNKKSRKDEIDRLIELIKNL
ncbi:MAG: helix-turn-helix transcriptional regulator [Patescibacteria group bacterium]